MKVIIVGGVAGGAYYATRILMQNEFKASNISGGMLSHTILISELTSRLHREFR